MGPPRGPHRRREGRRNSGVTRSHCRASTNRRSSRQQFLAASLGPPFPSHWRPLHIQFKLLSPLHPLTQPDSPPFPPSLTGSLPTEEAFTAIPSQSKIELSVLLCFVR